MIRASQEYNFVVKNEFWDEETEWNLFGDDPIEYTESFSFVEFLVKIGIFSSKGQAKKNNFFDNVGFNDIVVGKKKTRVTYWIPVSDRDGERA
jgi:hypothetical protein